MKPGVFRIPMEKVHKKKEEAPVQDHPMLRDWEAAEMWDGLVKSPIEGLSNYLYVMDCQIGTYDSTHDPPAQRCVFDNSTPISSTFGSEFHHVYTEYEYDPEESTSKDDIGV